MHRKIIHDYWLKYLNDLLRSELNVATFLISMDAMFFGMNRY